MESPEDSDHYLNESFDEADDGTDNDNKISVSPNLEDVFLVNYN